MSRLRLIGMAGGTLACALGIGYVMQRGQPAPPPIASPAPVSARDTPAAPRVEPPRPAPVRVRVAEAGAPDEALDIKKITLTSAAAEGDGDGLSRLPVTKTLPELSAAPGAVLPGTPEDPEMPALGCDVMARAVPGPMAMVDFSVSAPCLGNSRLVVHHSGMTFSAVTDADGDLNVTIPALAERAVFIAAFDNGEGAVATTRLADIADYDRVVLQWQGRAGFQIHAREFGASYGDPGHVWSGATPPAEPEHATGSVIRLGTQDALSPLLAEVYTFPARTADRSGTIALSVETEVTQDNCGRDISAQLLQRQGEDRVRTRQLDLAVPDCSATGDFLVLNNLLDDLKIAAK
ncbi:hypothetical protein [Antarcticimicrobium luteum]|uniref:Translocase n=1 Tax=Antarcticimicrobium luteum TaxID=2547397 RepID=A0A4R5UZ10_9RHOB|nr:hypothetical protein [Antarcticimicrobium luteum]TDK44395.1 hypothetical protein E1832_14870 [Antarcticimicrobium luteum]